VATKRGRARARVPAIRITLELPCAPREVFRALTDAKAIRAWSGSPGRVARNVGGRFRMWDGWNTGRVLSRRPPTVLAYTWRTDRWGPDVRDSVVRWKLRPAGGGTRVNLVHSRLPSLREYREHRAGWPTYFLKPLEKYLRRRR
jgi:uncharacterized protein YndB with AHSA1/START domain